MDFGCGSGNYTIPAALIVGREGKVYALNKERLEELREIARMRIEVLQKESVKKDRKMTRVCEFKRGTPSRAAKSVKEAQKLIEARFE